MSRLIDALGNKEGSDKVSTFFRYLQYYGRAHCVPLFGTFELTPRCTLDCVMCYSHLRPNQMGHCEINETQWISLIDQACDAGMIHATLTGGECTLHPGFKAIVKHLYNRGIMTSVLTNGTLLDQEMVDYLKQNAVESIKVSLYGNSPEMYNAITGHADAFEKACRAIERVAMSGINYNVSIEVIKPMLYDLENMLRFANRISSGHYFIDAYVFEARLETERDVDAYRLDIDEEIRALQMDRQIKNERSETSPSDEGRVKKDRESIAAIGQNISKLGCGSGISTFTISWDGQMHPCTPFTNMSSNSLEKGFHVAWKEINTMILNYSPPAECDICSLKDKCRRCPAIHFLGTGKEKTLHTRYCAARKLWESEKLASLSK